MASATRAPHPGARLLQVLFERAPDDLFLEIRPVPVLPKSNRFYQLGGLRQSGFDLAVPLGLDRHANVFFGACPRLRERGAAQDVAPALCVWADLDRGMPDFWLRGLPLPSITVATSPGKSQVYWLLKEPLRDLERLEDVLARLALALDGDIAATDRARILRLPGFQNLKYPDRPVAELVSLRPDLVYALEEIEAALPAERGRSPSAGRGPTPHDSGPFDPHRGGSDVPDAVKEELAQELQRQGALCHHDGRLVSVCPIPGHDSGRHGEFYFSPVSGRWWCFGEHHPGRQPGKTCIGGGPWSLWAALYPGRPQPRERETSTSTPLGERGVDASNSVRSAYEPGIPAPIIAHKTAPRHKRTAALLRLVGQSKKADTEETCGVPLKAKCSKPKHGVVREGRHTGKTPWCAGCYTETAARYLQVTFPDGPYTLLRLRRSLGRAEFDTAEVQHGVGEINRGDANLIAALIQDEYAAATGHFRRVQRRYPEECLGWHFAVAEDADGVLSVELQVLVRQTERLEHALQQLTGITRRKALFSPDLAMRFDYPVAQEEQLRRDWAGLLKCALLEIHRDLLFVPIFQALSKLQLSQAYGDLRVAYGQALEEERNSEGEDVTLCPVVEENGKVCAAKLTFFLDPDNKHPVNPLVYTQRRQQVAQGKGGEP